MDGRLKGREGRDRLIRRLGYLRFFFAFGIEKGGEEERFGETRKGREDFVGEGLARREG